MGWHIVGKSDAGGTLVPRHNVRGRWRVHPVRSQGPWKACFYPSTGRVFIRDKRAKAKLHLSHRPESEKGWNSKGVTFAIGGRKGEDREMGKGREKERVGGITCRGKEWKDSMQTLLIYILQAVLRELQMPS